jgi:ketosteroid isomerase-like protein
MYKRFAERQARGVFQALSEGDWRKSLEDVADDVHHTFPGDNAIGGERHSKQAMERWFERVYRLIPDLNFEVKRVAVKGPPWDLKVAVEWRDWGHAADGVAYENEGAHWIRIQRGKATYIHAYLDTGKVTELCRRLADGGIEEAAAPPITN